VDKYQYLISCPDNPWWPTTQKHAGDLINAMYDDDNEVVSYSEMAEYCEGVEEWARKIGAIFPDADVREAFDNSPFLTCYKGSYDNMPVYWVEWSSIEFIWCDEDALRARGII
jgi:hypothetical protein